jgi:zinc protease
MLSLNTGYERNCFMRLVLTGIVLLVFVTFALSQSLELQSPLPVDESVFMGKLENGLTYYVKQNAKPENRAELRLVVNAGSVLEDDNQQGLAHFVEHMAFNGTRDFAKNELVDYLESIGMRFGPDLNAYTSFDETVYMLQVPTDSLATVEKGIQILQNWANYIEFESEEIEKERGVIIEEWRLGRGAQARMRDEQLPVLFKNSKYAQRLPIGKKNILETFERETLLKFYRDWYRPDLMAVIAVGDLDVDVMQGLIEKYFSQLFPAEHPRHRPVYPVPDHDSTLFAIATDPEATRNSVTIYYKQDAGQVSTVAGYRGLLKENIYNRMFNERLKELVRQQNPPFLFGYSAKGRLIRSAEVYLLSAAVKENNIPIGLEALLTEARRIDRHGFTPSELQRQKLEQLRSIEQAFNERDKTESAQYASEYIRNFLTAEPIPGIEFEYRLYNELMPTISLDELNTLAREWISDSNRVVFVNAPEKETISVPSESKLLHLFQVVEHKSVKPYLDEFSAEKLVEKRPDPGDLLQTLYIDTLNVTEWRLSNGVRVILKPTDFKNDQVIMTAFSPGGHSLVSDSLYISALTAAAVIGESGVGPFNRTDLEKKLAGKIVRISPYIRELTEGFSGQASPTDLETLFQLVYLYFTAPRADSTAFLSFKSRIEGAIENKSASPEAVYGDTIQVTMAQHHFRSRPWSQELLDEMDLKNSFEIFQSRFADASDFTFILVGKFDLEMIRPLVLTYLGSLPAIERNETWRDVGIEPPSGRINKVIERGIEPKSRVTLIFTGPFEWTRQNRYLFQSMISALDIRLREIIREDMGGTYGVSVGGSPSHYPDQEIQINIQFGCDPERVDELSQTVLNEIKYLQKNAPDEIYVQKVTEMQRRQREVALKENSFWLSALELYDYHNMEKTGILTFDEFITKLSARDIQNAIKEYFDFEQYARFVLMPQN